MREYLAVTDVHAPDKLRCNRVLQTLPEFYTTYDIQPGDGMWTAPETRVSVWQQNVRKQSFSHTCIFFGKTTKYLSGQKRVAYVTLKRVSG